MFYSKSGKLYSSIPADKQKTKVKLTSAYFSHFSAGRVKFTLAKSVHLNIKPELINSD